MSSDRVQNTYVCTRLRGIWLSLPCIKLDWVNLTGQIFFFSCYTRIHNLHTESISHLSPRTRRRKSKGEQRKKGKEGKEEKKGEGKRETERKRGREKETPSPLSHITSDHKGRYYREPHTRGELRRCTSRRSWLRPNGQGSPYFPLSTMSLRPHRCVIFPFSLSILWELTDFLGF